MKHLNTLLIVLLLFSTNDLQAQTKRKYLVFAYAQKPINLGCNSNVLILQKEVEMEPKEKSSYEGQLKKSLSTEYNTKNGFKNLNVRVIPGGSFVICYEGVKKVDSWNCSSSFYGIIVEKDAATAMAKYNIHIKKDDKIKYTIIKEWSGVQD